MKKLLFIIIAGLTSLITFAQIPVLNSYPAAAATLYIDFDGEYVFGTGWNFNGPIDAKPADLSEAAMQEIFARVAEDYRVFNVNITTDFLVFAATPISKRMRVIVTQTHEWSPGAGGTSYTKSFSWGDDTPAWVFSAALGNNPKNIAEAISHELGHTLGLHHQSNYSTACGKLEEYSTGQGTGEIGWAPIMGVGYNRNMTTWHTGTNAKGCTTIQEDINVIASSLNGFGLKQDDHGDSHDSATEIPVGPIDFEASGMINSYQDRDVFKFSISTPTNVRINAIPQNVGPGNNGANVDIKVGLLSSFTDTIGKYNPMELLNAGVDTNLNAGTYFIVVDGVSNQNLSDYGSVGSYALVGNIALVLPIHNFQLTARDNNGFHELNWSFKADEAIRKVQVEISKDGRRYSTLAELSADARNYSWKPIDNAANFYRIKTITVADERAYYSNVEVIKAVKGQTIDIMSTMVTSAIQLNSKGSYPYQLVDETGRLLQKGTIKIGSNSIELRTGAKGLYLLRVQNGIDITTYKILKQ
jgi:hypothetical protein